MNDGIAIIGMGCHYPDADSPVELWENVLAQRQSFRRMPSSRLCLEDYLSVDRTRPDSIYSTEAALISNYEFDRLSFQIAKSTFQSADITHWLALDTASQALTDAGFPHGEGLPRDTTGVCLGNTLTGELSRTHMMRLRWPYVRRVVETALIEENWSPDQCHAFFNKLESAYKKPFPPVGEETLAGGLSNTIAGRVCNYFNLKGSGYVVDGACASSLLAVTNACSALLTGDLDVALAGGVDVSLDPFELVGFSKMGALAPHEMRVYDAHSAGFWPGEGCGFVVLMRYQEALEKGRRIYGVIRGWGISSDGSGGITRPEVEGHRLMFHRAYKRAGFGIETVTYFEGHGTGTAVGDATELQALSQARREAGLHTPPAVIGSIKANIGHTKAAAGVAGLIKATMALHTQVVPPTTGCYDPHPTLTANTEVIQIQKKGASWSADLPLRVGVSAMGFGGINTHIVLEGIGKRKKGLTHQEKALLSSGQDAELFLMGGYDADDLQKQVEQLLPFAAKLSRSELTDLAAAMERSLYRYGVRAAVVASTPAQFVTLLEALRLRLAHGVRTELDIHSGLFLSAGADQPRIGFLFPGQGIPTHLDGGALRRRFDGIRDLFKEENLSAIAGVMPTDVAQPAIAAASLAGLRVLSMLGIRASIAVGHSLGEIIAYHWANAFDESALLRIATVRGGAMAQRGSPGGAMASIMAGPYEVKELLNGETIVIACLNAPNQTVVSGEAHAVAVVMARARIRKLTSIDLPVSQAFHSPLVAAAAPILVEQLSREAFQPLQQMVVSTVTGTTLTSNHDLRKLLSQQVTQPVRFVEAMAIAEKEADLFIEVGPGAILSGLIGGFVKAPVVALDVGGPSLKGLLKAVGAAFAMGASIDHKALFAGRFTRPFHLDWHPKFFTNPCGGDDGDGHSERTASVGRDAACGRGGRANAMTQNNIYENNVTGEESKWPSRSSTESALDVIRQVISQRVELPLSTIKEDSRMLSDLHLNSITVSQLVIEAARSLGLPPPVLPMDYANAKVGEIAKVLEDMASSGVLAPADDKARLPSGVDAWIRAFTTDLVERPISRHRIMPSRGASPSGVWQVIAPEDHPLKETLQEALTRLQGGGIVVCLPPADGVPSAEGVSSAGVVTPLLLAGARAVLAEGATPRFVLVQQGGCGAAFVRTLHLEVSGMTTSVIDLPLTHPKATEWIIDEMMAATGYTEAHYDASGRRREPVLRYLPITHEVDRASLGPSDVLLVTGGGKGITAECAIALARDTGTRLALLGRSLPATDAELAANLDRMAAYEISFRYVVADVADVEAVRTAVAKVTSDLGPVTGILHGAGRNVPQSVNTLDEAEMLRTLAPKVQGIYNLLAAVNPDALRLFVTFSSIIARIGLPGEAHYGLANEALTLLTEQFQKDHPACRCLAVEWSAWSDVGMAQHLGGIDRLVRQGITPIPTDEGVSILCRLLSQKLPSVAVVVTGRFGEPPTLKIEKPELPLLRFLESPRVYYPGVELISDVALSVDTDPYVTDHLFQGERLFPAVMGLEAMAQVAMALMGTECPPVFEDVKFHRPIGVPAHAPRLIRIAALVCAPDQVEVILRTEETAFQVDHFRAKCHFIERGLQGPDTRNAKSVIEAVPRVNIDPDHDLYGGILFQSGRFQRLTGYRQLRATECIAEIRCEDTTNWFGRYLSHKRVLGDPGVRDAAIHAVQASIPHATILPIGVDRIVPGVKPISGPCYVHAWERSREGDIFTYDLEVTGPRSVYERWEGIQLRVIEKNPSHGPWVAPLLGPYIERRVGELIPNAVIHVAMGVDDDPDRRLRSDRAIHQAMGKTVPIARRSDGKPEVADDKGISVSAAHAGPLTLAVAGVGPIGCDLEPVLARPARIWRDLLGPERFALMEVIARETGEAPDTSATRVWAASECLKKAGAMANTPFVFFSSTADGWVQLATGLQRIATYVAPTRGIEGMLAMAVLVGAGK
jgi:enediyne polyketide synthase